MASSNQFSLFSLLNYKHDASKLEKSMMKLTEFRPKLKRNRKSKKDAEPTFAVPDYPAVHQHSGPSTSPVLLPPLPPSPRITTFLPATPLQTRVDCVDLLPGISGLDLDEPFVSPVQHRSFRSTALFDSSYPLLENVERVVTNNIQSLGIGHQATQQVGTDPAHVPTLAAGGWAPVAAGPPVFGVGHATTTLPSYQSGYRLSPLTAPPSRLPDSPGCLG
ncbi:hypothetical protein BDP27DRAFT_1421452 [Rhodocollybia butyracea]|uniref:Uncharacterized protein n=1 Tax=Rhodocollybia butyracea TaxID=206335 RepID=A0A9P5PS49_9AGAR|nr:hypothetical protein BDP27DRAFT_1421452 [Rhodocollybia butyracea]